MPKKLTDLEIAYALQNQLGALQRAVDLFDLGFEAEAPRIATILRVLLHTGINQSLLKLLELDETDFWDSSTPFDPLNLAPHHGLTSIRFNNTAIGYIPKMGDVDQMSPLEFDDWWNATVLNDLQGQALTRRDLVRNAANKDGGAHVATSIPENYDALKNGNSLGWLHSQGSPLEGNAVFASIRQIAHEVLHTFLSNYNKTHDDITDARNKSEISNGKLRFAPHENRFFINSLTHPLKPGHEYEAILNVDKITTGAIYAVANRVVSEPIFLPGNHKEIIIAGNEEGTGVFGAFSDAILDSISIREILSS